MIGRCMIGRRMIGRRMIGRRMIGRRMIGRCMIGRRFFAATTALVNSSALHHFTFFVHLDFYQVITARVNDHTTIAIVCYQYVFTPRTNDSVTASQQGKLSIVHADDTQALIHCPFFKSCMLIVNLTLHLSESIQYISPGFVIIPQMIGKVINIAVIAILLQYVLR